MRAPSETTGNPPGNGRIAGKWSHLPALLGGGGLIIVVIVLLVGGAILRSRTDARHTADVATANLSLTLADNFNNTIDKVDLGLLSILDEVVRQKKAGRWDDAAIIATIARQDARHTESFGYRILGPDEEVLYGGNTLDPETGDSRRDAVAYLRRRPDASLVMEAPAIGASGRQASIALSRRITNPDASYGGRVLCALSLPALLRFFSTLDLGPGGTVALYHASFGLAARYPEAAGPRNPAGTIAASEPLRAVMASGVGTAQFDYTSLVDGRRRVATARRIDGWPYYIVVSFAEDDYLKGWRRDRTYFLLVGALAVGLVLLAMWGTHRHISAGHRTTAELAEKIELLGWMTLSDGLTGVANRRCFDDMLGKEWRRCQRAGCSMALILVDVDHFKAFNDHYGHQAGDACLIDVAGALSACVRRPPDIVARYGGEEFALLLPHATLEGAQTIAGRALENVRALAIAHAASSCAAVVTVSLGVAAMLPDGTQSTADLVAAADARLYQAKAAGRNKFCPDMAPT
jgi:diguanylate cyclase (GGDEF)-like protein